MAKNKQTNAKQTKSTNKRAAPRAKARGPLDAGGKEYARLLADPCYGKLTTPLYDSVGSGNLVRLESDFILGAEATSVGCAVLFTPGLISTTGSSGVTIPTTVVNSDSGTITWSPAYANQPGYAMRTSFGAVRAVSACMQVSYVGAEQTRAGVIALGQTNLGQAILNTTTSALRGMAERVVRTPDGVLEIKMKPNAHSSTFVTVGDPTVDAPLENPCLVCSVTGIPSSVGIRIRLVQVLEWMPATGMGVQLSATSLFTKNTLLEVLRYLGEKNPSWQYDLLTGLGAYAAKTITYI